MAPIDFIDQLLHQNTINTTFGYVPKSSTLPLINFVRVSLNNRIIYHVENQTDCCLYLIIFRNKCNFCSNNCISTAVHVYKSLQYLCI